MRRASGERVPATVRAATRRKSLQLAATCPSVRRLARRVRITWQPGVSPAPFEHAILRRIVERHDGGETEASRAEEGAIFRLYALDSPCDDQHLEIEAQDR